MLKYFITYSIAGTGMVGRCDVHLPKPIRGIGDIESVEAVIARSQGRSGGVMVTGWQRFEGQEHVEHEM